MKINLELEHGMETGTIVGALELLISNLAEVKKLKGETTNSPILLCAIRLKNEIDRKLEEFK